MFVAKFDEVNQLITMLMIYEFFEIYNWNNEFLLYQYSLIFSMLYARLFSVK